LLPGVLVESVGLFLLQPSQIPSTGRYARRMFLGFAHVGVCVPDVEAAIQWYSEVLGLKVLSPPYRMAGEDIERDMGELLPSPVVVKAAIVGLGADDHVLELIEYPEAGVLPRPSRAGSITTPGLTHVGLVCDDLDRTREVLEERGVEFIVSGIAEVAGLRTTWFTDPWGTVFILLEKGRTTLPYWHQYGP
jgi:catechol 2,3-dioxygenase-like lactoylglutathione lyase family enzyme